MIDDDDDDDDPACTNNDIPDSRSMTTVFWKWTMKIGDPPIPNQKLAEDFSPWVLGIVPSESVLLENSD